MNDPPPNLFAVAALGLCPRCGGRTLFDWIARFAPTCRVCGLNFARFNVGDGPASFLILIVGTVVCVVASWLFFAFAPPWWVYALVLAPLSLGLILYGLRAAKAALLASEFRRDAGQAGGRDVAEP